MPLRILHFILFASAFFLLNFSGLFAQSQPVPLLPDIDPQDIEIKGNYRPQFQGLRRQPVLGFNPTPPIFSQEGPRIPFFETPDQIAAGTTISFLERPPQPKVTLRDVPSRKNDYLQLGLGNMFTPEARFIHDAGGEINRFVTDAAFTSSKGHLDERNTAFRFFSISQDWIYRPFVDTDWRAGASFHNADFYLFSPASGTVPLAELNRGFNRFDLSGEYAFNRGMYRQFRITAKAGFENAGLTNSVSDESGYSYSLQAAGKKAAAKTEQWWDYSGGVIGFSPNSSPSLSAWVTGNLKGTYSARYASGWRWKAGLNVVGGSDDSATKMYLFPELELRFQDPDWLDFRLVGFGEAQNLNLQQVLTANRYLKTLNTLANEYKYTTAAELVIRPARLFSLHGALTGTHFWNYRYVSYRPSTLPVNVTNLGFAIAEDVRIIRPSAGVKLWMEDSGLVWYNEIYWQNVSSSIPIPFMEKLGLVSDLSWQFLQKWYGQVTLRYISDRETPISGTSVDGFLPLDARLEYKIDSMIGVYLSGQNLMNESYQIMPGYVERPVQVLGGISLRF